MTHWSICLICLLTRSQNRSTHSGSSTELATNHKTAQQLLMKDKLCSLAFKKQLRLFVQMPSILIAYILWPVQNAFQSLLKVIDYLYFPWNVKIFLLLLRGKALIFEHWEIICTHTRVAVTRYSSTNASSKIVFSLLDIESRPRPYCIKVGGFYLVNKRNIFQCICHIYSEAISNDYITGHSQYILLPGTNNAVPCIRFFFFSVAEYNRILLWIWSLSLRNLSEGLGGGGGGEGRWQKRTFFFIFLLCSHFLAIVPW